MNDLPIELIQASKVLTKYVNEMNISAIKVDYLGGIHFINPEGKEEYVSPIASDFMFMRLSGYFEQVKK